MEKFERKYFASWTDLDPNWHVANHAYIKYATDTRVSFFSELKLDKDKFNTRREFFSDPQKLALDFDNLDRYTLSKNSLLGWLKSLIFPDKFN